MGPTLQFCYILPGLVADAFAQTPVGKLVPVLRTTADPVHFTRLDCFDQSLRRSDRMLLDLGTVWEVILPLGQTIAQPVPHREKCAADLAEGPLRQALADMSPLRRLLPFGSGTLRRSQLGFEDGAGKTRCRVDLLTLTGTDAPGATIIWLQGLRGYDKALNAVRHHSLACGGTAFSAQTLHTLLFPGQIVYQAKPPIHLTADLPVFDAATRIIAGHIPVAQQNEAGIMADLDTEFLHDHRVALRKIRSVLSLFKGVLEPTQTAALKARFSALMARTGPLRDLDVLLLEKQHYYDPLPPSLHAGLDSLFTLREAERAKALTKLTRHLNSRRHAQEMAELSHLFSASSALAPGPKADIAVRTLARALIWKRFKVARVMARSIGPDTPDLALHDLRIHCKKLRYLMEFSGSLFSSSAVKPAVQIVKALQTNLGQINDVSVQLSGLHSAMMGTGDWQDGEKLQLAQSLGALTAIVHQRKQLERLKTDAIVARFASPQTHDLFRDLFHQRTPEP